jgi:glutamyl-tRNA synthetase
LELLVEGPLTLEQAQDLLAKAVTAAGVKKGVLMKTLRAALLGSLQGPDLLSTWLLLHPSGEAAERMRRSL